MGKPVIVLMDKSIGHSPGFPPTPAIQASNKVFASGKPIVRQGDKYQKHCFNGSCHIPVVASASTKVFIQGKGCTRLGDKLSCGDTASGGVSKVRAG